MEANFILSQLLFSQFQPINSRGQLVNTAVFGRWNCRVQILPLSATWAWSCPRPEILYTYGIPNRKQVKKKDKMIGEILG